MVTAIVLALAQLVLLPGWLKPLATRRRWLCDWQVSFTMGLCLPLLGAR
jgi:hypothetical protein